ncbi:cation-dependent mannose-6-phosphate receptor-like [Pocillopora verrucosa]|uniref:cation-dependent mannose-6-phosphate receptor-like n=1 Tax=Pocillopora verrucosa TaxID=203993 RepID=UPI00333E5446
METLSPFMKAVLLWLGLCTRFVSVRTTTQAPGQMCPQHQKTDPNDVNERIKKLSGQKIYFANDDDYSYKISICKRGASDTAAVQQHGVKWKESDWKVIGTFRGAHVTGGTDWLMIKYFHGEEYTHHCKGLERISIVLMTCDPGVERGTMRVIEEYRNQSSVDDPKNPLECYYLFELNNDAACTAKPKHLSAGSIMLIILIVVGSIYLILGFLYQRYMVGAKGMEQIPNYNFWKDCGSLQADGCNFMCRCSESSPTRYKAMDDALADDDRDDTLLPM